VLTDDVRRQIAASRPGETYMPPRCAGDPMAVVESWVGEAEITGTMDSYLGKRHWPRFTWDAIVLIRVKSGEFSGKVIRARARNVSMTGIGIQIRSVLQSGTSVEIMIEGRPYGVSGAVAHCTPILNGNLLGVSFDYRR
jgi:hypothetical protein